jgi:hypothetical protein
MRPGLPRRWQRHLRRALGVAAGLLVAAGVGRAGERRGPAISFESTRWPDTIASNERLLAPTDVGNMRLMLSNSGTFGTAFQSRDTPSMEWPARSGIDHLVRAALWIGAISAATGDTLVTIGGRDAYYTDPIFQNSEFTPVSGRPQEYSRLRTSPYYRSGTVADENFHTIFVDTIPIAKEGAEQRHRPMGLRVVQETYSWGFDPLDDFVIAEFNIINVGEVALQDVWVGIYSELVTNNRQANWGAWPPGGRWFDFQDPHFDRPRHMLWNHNVEHRFVNDQLRAGIKAVGCGGHGPTGRGPDSLSTKEITLAAWNWSPTQFLTWSDDSLYARMSTGQIANLDSLFDPNIDDNPVSVLAVGPFSLLAPGDTTQVVFAMLAGDGQADLEKNAAWAQKAYDDRYAVPSPPSSPILHVYPRHNELVMRWSSQPESELDPASRLPDFEGYRVYLSDNPQAASFRILRQLDKRNSYGFDTGFDAVRLAQPYIDGRDTLQYELRLPGIPDGQKRYVAVTSYDRPTGEVRSLESGVLQNSIYCTAGPDAQQARASAVSVFPNPYRGESELDGRDAQGTVNPRKRVMWFVNLPSRCTLRIYTLAGDLVRTYEYDAATYKGTEAAGVSPDNADLSQGRYLVTGGSMLAFDLLSENRQEIATGMYLFTVVDHGGGETQQGKFLVLK